VVYYKNLDDTGTVGYLGNKLFDLAAGYQLALDNSVDLVIPRSELDFIFENKFFDSVDKSTITPTSEYHEPFFHYQKIPYQSGINLNGYFQSYKYFDIEQIRKVFVPSKSVKTDVNLIRFSKINSVFSEVLKNFTVCSIHVRRGDYLNFSAHHTNLTLDYYRQAIQEIKSRVKIDYFIVFSNDIPWCKVVFNGDEFLFSESNQERQQGNNSAAMDLFAISECHHNIIANSSFSWWGAHLNKNLNKIVVSPNGKSYNWFGPALRHDTKDLIPEGWIQL
jgi:hypothetical protein